MVFPISRCSLLCGFEDHGLSIYGGGQNSTFAGIYSAALSCGRRSKRPSTAKYMLQEDYLLGHDGAHRVQEARGSVVGHDVIERPSKIQGRRFSLLGIK